MTPHSIIRQHVTSQAIEQIAEELELAVQKHIAVMKSGESLDICRGDIKAAVLKIAAALAGKEIGA